MCGKEAALHRVEIESVNLAVCPSCAAYGKPTARSNAITVRPKQKMPEGPSHRLVPDFSSRLKRVREARNMTQREFATLLQERESMVAKWELGAVRPSLEAAQHLEKRLGIALVEEEEGDVAVSNQKKKAPEGLTLGDFMAFARKR